MYILGIFKLCLRIAADPLRADGLIVGSNVSSGLYWTTFGENVDCSIDRALKGLPVVLLIRVLDGERVLLIAGMPWPCLD